MEGLSIGLARLRSIVPIDRDKEGEGRVKQQVQKKATLLQPNCCLLTNGIAALLLEGGWSPLPTFVPLSSVKLFALV